MKVTTLKCPECNADIDIEEGLKKCYCKYCGCPIIIDNEKHETTINKNININNTITKREINDAEIIKAHAKAKQQEKDSKESNVVLIVLLIFMLFCIGMMYLPQYLTEKKIEAAINAGKISAGSYEDLEGQNYKSVVATLEAAGFENIEVIDLNDSGIFIWQDEKVEQVSVGGNTTFSSSDYFSKDTKVVISYH